MKFRFAFAVAYQAITEDGVQINSSQKIRIGIVGSGIAGLSAAWLLNRQGFEVTLFEKGPKS